VLLSLAAIAWSAWQLLNQWRARHHFQLAQAAVDRYRYQQAKEHLQICYALRPDDAATVLLAARVARCLQAFDEAGQFLDRYRTLRGDDDELTLERVLLRAERGDVDGVRNFCDLMIEQKHPHASRILEALVAGHLRMFRLDDAMGSIRLWQEREPDNAQAEYLKGYILEHREQHGEAMQAYRRTVQLDPEHDTARYRLAGLLLDLSQVDALPHLQHLAARQPRDPNVLLDLARCLERLGRHEGAASALDRALELNPDLVGAIHERALMALRQDQTAEAERLLQKASFLAPGNYQVHYQLALCLERLGKEEEAREMTARAKKIEEDGRRLRDIVARHMPRTPKDPNLHSELALLYLRAGAVAEGLRWLDSALQLDPKHAAAHEAYVAYYRALGQFGRAAEHLPFIKPAPERK
jgi:tetratricopeptide (TPR) repeat protein